MMTRYTILQPSMAGKPVYHPDACTSIFGPNGECGHEDRLDEAQWEAEGFAKSSSGDVHLVRDNQTGQIVYTTKRV